MRSYSIAVLFHITEFDADLLAQIQAFRQTLSFASIYVYAGELETERRIALQKLDVTIRHDSTGNHFHVARRMFTEIDADVFVYVGKTSYPANIASTLIHQLIETRKDMTSAHGQHNQSQLQDNYRDMCEGLYGQRLLAPLSDYRVFSRRFVKSFSAFERGFPIELEWTIHALELDIPFSEHAFETAEGISLMQPHTTTATCGRTCLTRIILNLQSRPMKWFGLLTLFYGTITLVMKFMLLMEFWSYDMPGTFAMQVGAAIASAIFTALSAVTGLILHSQSHNRREIKRLHFQQHSTL